MASAAVAVAAQLIQPVQGDAASKTATRMEREQLIEIEARAIGSTHRIIQRMTAESMLKQNNLIDSIGRIIKDEGEQSWLKQGFFCEPRLSDRWGLAGCG